MVGISKTTYYQAEDPKDRFLSKYKHIKKKVEKIIVDNPGYGIRRIKKELAENYQTNIGRDTLGKLLKFWGLSMKRKIKKKKPNMIQKILIALAERANLLIRSVIDQPFQAISSDISQFKYRAGKFYLCIHKDVYGQMVYGWEVSLKQDTQLVMSSFSKAVKKIKRLIKPIGSNQVKKAFKKMLWHQDRGSQYTSYAYVGTVLKNGKLSYSNPGTPTHNPGQESFFGRFKDDWKDEIAELETFQEVKRFVKEKINYYNNQRRHTSIELVSPRKFTKMFLKKQR